MADCPVCGADLVLVGKAHNCRPKRVSASVQRVQRWREKNRERYNAYMREYRRKK